MLGGGPRDPAGHPSGCWIPFFPSLLSIGAWRGARRLKRRRTGLSAGDVSSPSIAPGVLLARSPAPTPRPSSKPTTAPPTPRPSSKPTTAPPTPKPSPKPTTAPSLRPTTTTTAPPSPRPTPAPVPRPTERPTPAPVPRPTERPTPAPVPRPTERPTPAPVPRPTERPTPAPDGACIPIGQAAGGGPSVIERVLCL